MRSLTHHAPHRGAAVLPTRHRAQPTARLAFGAASNAGDLLINSSRSVATASFGANMLQGLKSALSGGGSGARGAPTAAPPIQQQRFSDNAPSWDALAELVRSQELEFGVNFTAPDLETGPPNPLSLRRTFGSTSPIRVKLYRDHAAWCPYCQKVWLQLEEKRIPYEIEKINMRCYGDKPASFTAKVPSGLLPVLELDGRVVTESSVIMALLEDTFPDHTPLMPPRADAPARARAESLLRLERRFFSAWLGWLCGGGGRAELVRTLDVIDAELAATAADGPYFLGAELSLADVTFAPMLERASASLAYYKGFFMRGGEREGEGGEASKWPALEAWFDAMEARPAYLATRADYYSSAWDLPPQLGGCLMEPAGEAVAKALSTWRLPLAPLSPRGWPEPYAPGEDAARDRLEAAARLVNNHAAVVRFALRGAGSAGARRVSAPLSDPSAVPALEHTDAADAALRHVAHALLVGVNTKQVSADAALQVVGGGEGGDGGYEARAASASAAYLRARVGVPRDLRFPAARQLRAHLTWLIDALAAQQQQ